MVSLFLELQVCRKLDPLRTAVSCCIRQKVWFKVRIPNSSNSGAVRSDRNRFSKTCLTAILTNSNHQHNGMEGTKLDSVVGV